MAENNDTKHIVSLVLGPEWLTGIKNSTIKVFGSLEALLNSLPQLKNNNSLLRLFLPGEYLKQLIDNNIHKLEYIDSINGYYNSAMRYDSDIRIYRDTSDKIHFLMTNDLITRILAVYENAAKRQVQPTEQTAPQPTPVRRRKKKKSKGVVISNSISPDMNCPKCSTLFQEPYQLNCGHRQCKSCIDKEQG